MATPDSEPDHAIWSRLPHILLPIIIENTADFPTLEAWCRSTQHSSYLHRIAIQETYRTYQIDTNRFKNVKKPVHVRDDNENDNHNGNHNHHDDVASDSKPTDESRPDSYESPDCAKFHQEIGPHVKRLVLDLEYLDLQTQGAVLPLTEDLGSIWQSFLCYATRLEKIEQNGILRQGMLDRMLATPSLNTLKIREIRSKYVTRSDDLLLTWERLGQCSSLRVLHVGQLFYSEAVGLAIAIRGLHSLEELRVKASELACPGANMPPRSDDPSPLKPFLRSLYQKTGPGFDRTPVGFPVSLKKLALVDFNSRYV